MKIGEIHIRSIYWPEGVAGSTPEEEEVEAKIPWNVFAKVDGGS